LARKALTNRRGTFVDEDDIVQSAMASFYLRAKEGHFPKLNERDGLWKILITITLNKARAHARKEGRRTEILDREFAGQNFLTGEPSPELACEMAEQFEVLLNSLDDDLLREIALAKLEGYTNPEIAKRTGKSLPTIERKLRYIRNLWTGESIDTKDS
jgi:DNA-directed RNA polymerase specialized sigma24 family protein